MKYIVYAIASVFLVPAFLLVWLGVMLGVIGFAVGESVDD